MNADPRISPLIENAKPHNTQAAELHTTHTKLI